MMFKTMILSFCLLGSSVASADFFSELTGEAARQRTREARERAGRARQQVETLQGQLNAKRAEIATRRASIAEQTARSNTLRTNLNQQISAEITRLESESQQQEVLKSSLQAQLERVQQLEGLFSSFSAQSLATRGSAEAALAIGRALQNARGDWRAWSAAFNNIYPDLTEAQQKILERLAGHLVNDDARLKELSFNAVTASLRELLANLSIEKTSDVARRLANLRATLQDQIEKVNLIVDGNKLVVDGYKSIRSTLERAFTS